MGCDLIGVVCQYALYMPSPTTRNSSPFLEIPGDVEELVLDIIYELPLLLRGQRLGPNIIWFGMAVSFVTVLVDSKFLSRCLR